MIMYGSADELVHNFTSYFNKQGSLSCGMSYDSATISIADHNAPVMWRSSGLYRKPIFLDILCAASEAGQLTPKTHPAPARR
jgi:hypothetical protein